MNGITVSVTDNGTKKYPLHKHNAWEVMYYLQGEGHLATSEKNIDFNVGTIIIVPPHVYHGSVSEDGFINISIGGNFNHLFMFDKITAQQDNIAKDGKRLATLIFENRHTDRDYLSALCNAYAHFLLQNAKYDKKINRVISEMIGEISNNFFDPRFDTTSLLNQSGYAEDYIRSQFKKATALSPVDFLTKERIDHAQKLFEIYGQNISVAQVAEACGFEDSVYFSRRFKQFAGCSPNEYKKHFIAKER